MSNYINYNTDRFSFEDHDPLINDYKQITKSRILDEIRVHMECLKREISTGYFKVITRRLLYR